MKYFIIFFIMTIVFSLLHPTRVALETSDKDDSYEKSLKRKRATLFEEDYFESTLIEKIAETEYPYTAFLLDHDRETGCTAVIVDDTFLLTAAHCVIFRKCSNIEVFRNYGKLEQISDEFCEMSLSNPKSLRIYAGGLIPRDSPSISRVESVYVHPDYQYYNSKYGCFGMSDIALLKLDKPLVFTANISSVRLPGKNDRLNMRTKCTVLGWGQQSDNDTGFLLNRSLKIFEVFVTPWYNCSLFFCRRTGICSQNPVNNGGICAGDSGGPLMCQNKLFGVSSSGTGCGNKQSFYIRVKPALDWIKAVISNNKKKRTVNDQL